MYLKIFILTGKAGGYFTLKHQYENRSVKAGFNKEKGFQRMAQAMLKTLEIYQKARIHKKARFRSS